ncbi:hypothetical protein FA13DRAFT_1779009 [Coprinellus micaceus]|uniref:DUF6533 domain-containing protein n=1 Tax=Coprinellus micaceus TaxID=71717 RepID=A0A4Y7SJR3_COPMI|nr:hypothetical protein FA13DRAFT_1779009 [Coprinellus micaceus]
MIWIDPHSQTMLSDLDLHAVSMLRTERYLTALTFTLCDILETLQDEIHLIWRSKWTAAKILYLASRYVGVVLLLVLMQGELPIIFLASASLIHGPALIQREANLVSQESFPYPSMQYRQRHRLHIRMVSVVGSLVGFGIANTVTALRIYALYDRVRCVLYFLIALWASELVAGGFTVVRLLLDYTEVLSGFPGNCSTNDALAGVCIFIKNDFSYRMRFAHILAMTVLALSCTIHLIMTLLKLKDSLTDSEGTVRYEVLKQVSYATPIAGVFISDGALSLILLLGVELATVLCDLDNTVYYNSPTRGWVHAIFAHVGSSLILNLRRAGGRGTPTSIVQRQDETIDWDAVRLDALMDTRGSGRIEGAF